MGNQDEEIAFENEVRRVARWIYPNTDRQGAAHLNGRERDAVLITDDVTVAIEATVSTTSGKARFDAKKLIETMAILRNDYPDRPCTGIFITQKEPTNYQRQAVMDVAGSSVACMSLDVFRSRLVDIGEYLACRDRSPFGSARHPLTDSTTDLENYNPLDLLDVNTEAVRKVDDLEQLLVQGKRVVVVGEYGAGKSMTLRELYRRLTVQYRSGNQYRSFPIYLNLREHHGQTEPAEALERHARSIGFSRPDKLVRAWRSGMCTVLLDGFDEIAPASLAGAGRDPNSLKELNYRSVALVRQLVRQTPAESAIAITGRSHYFRSQLELEEALGVVSSTTFSLSDFTPSQVRQYLQRQGWDTSMPDWLPRRPLLLGWLASRDFLSSTVDVGHLPASQGWNWLLSAIFRRESDIEGGIDGETLRQILESTATTMRPTSSGLGPIYFDDLRRIFSQVLNYGPDERQEVLLRRLPGLGIHNAATGSKQFIDASLADASRAGDVARFIISPDAFPLESRKWNTLMEGLGVEVCADLISNALGADRALGATENALRRCSRSDTEHALTADVFAVAQSLGLANLSFPIVLRNLIIPEVRLGESPALQSVVIEDCLIERLEMGSIDDPTILPSFARCHIMLVDGATRREDLPEIFNSCDFDAFTNTGSTTNELIQLELPLGVRIGLVAMRKLYWQRGGSRREDALSKGIPPNDRQHVRAVMRVLAAHDLATMTRHGNTTIWQPVVSRTTQVRRWLTSPSTVSGSVFEALSKV